jgi:hypothetical protein
MFGWIKQRLLARKCRQALARSRSAAAERRAFPPDYSPAPSKTASPASSDPLVVNQALVLSAVLDDGRRAAPDCSSSSSSYSGSSWSGSDSSGSCSGSSSSWD